MYIYFMSDFYLRKNSCSHDQVSLLKKDRKDGRSALKSSFPR